jgi:4-oxalomesaconate tautomerase
VVVLRAADLGCTGREDPKALESNEGLKAKVEAIRLACGKLMNLGDVARKTVPKMSLVAAPAAGGAIATRTFIPHRVHEAIGVLGAVSVATACLLPGSVAASVAHVSDADAQRIDVEHPTGFFTIDMRIDRSGNEVRVTRSALLRTCRKLMSGEVYVPNAVWAGHDRAC